MRRSAPGRDRSAASSRNRISPTPHVTCRASTSSASSFVSTVLASSRSSNSTTSGARQPRRAASVDQRGERADRAAAVGGARDAIEVDQDGTARQLGRRLGESHILGLEVNVAQPEAQRKPHAARSPSWTSAALRWRSGGYKAS